MNVHIILDYCMHSPSNTNKVILEQLLRELGGTHDGRFTIKQVVDYVMYTKHNTNRAVLETMLRSLKGHTPTPEPPTPQKRTVLYADGTFIMNELPGDAQTNESTHGVVVNEYPPLDASHNYVFMRDADRPWNSDAGQIKSVKFGSFVAPTSTSKWFSGCTRLTTFDATNLSTEDTTDMGDMFNSCSSLTDFDMTVLDLSNTTTVQQMFSRCLNLRHINLENIDTSNIEKFTSMFQGCSGLTSIDVSKFDTSNAKTIAGMFWGCSGLTELNVSNFDTTNITGMGNVFNGCSGLTELDLSNFDTAKVTSIVAMFSNCSNLTTIYVSDKFVTTAVTSTGQVFQNSMRLVGGAGTVYDNLQLGKDYARIDNPPDEPGYLTLKMPKKRTVLYEDGTLILNELETDIAENERVHGIATNVYPPMDENNDYVFASLEDRPWHGERATIVKAEIGSPMQPTSTAHWFEQFSHCNHIDVYGLDTSQVTSMAAMFSGTAVETLDLSKFDTSNVTNMYQMFTNNTRLTELDLSSFDTSKVTDTRMMFMRCSLLETIYASDAFDISSLTPTETSTMFQWCSAIVGGDGTAYDMLKTNGEYARIDNLPDTPGYFTRKDEGRRTVLFTDGTLIINQLPMRKSMDIALHGAEVKVYPAFSAEHPYVWVSDTEVYWHAERTQIKAVNIGSAIAPTSTSNWFDGCSSLETFTSSVILNTANTNDMSYMFRDCKALTSVDLSHCNVANVITMANMFSGCEALTSVNVSTFTTTKLRNMGGMFMGCGALTTVDLSSFDTSQVESMNNMFRACTSLTSLDLSNFDTAKVEDMNSLFHSCKALATLDVSGFDTSSVTDMTRMFVECEAFTTLDLTSFDTSKVTLMTDMFKDMINLTTITVDEDKFTTAALNGTQAMFHGSTKLVGGAGTRYDSSKYDSRFAVVDFPPTAPGYFTGKAITKRTVLYTDGTLIMNELSDDSAENERIHGAATDVYPPFDAEHNYVFNSYADRYWQSKTSNIKKVEFGSEMQPTSMMHWFRNCEALTTFDWTNLDTSKVEDMSYLFMNCNALQNVDLTSFNTSKVSSMYNMLFGCIKMTSIDVSSFNTENVLLFDSMFYNCYELETIDLSNFDTSSATNLSFMFYGCSKLTNVDLSSFDTANVEDMDSMFYECTKLKTLDLTSFDSQSLTNLESMFGECVNLETIYASEAFDASHVGSEHVFTRCVKLVGGAGTTFDSTFIDADYAHIDGGTSNPGYFTSNKRTVLYNDGTLIINELAKDNTENERLHEGVRQIYPPLDEGHEYIFGDYNEVYWYGDKNFIYKVQFGSEVKPTYMNYWFARTSNLKDFDWTNLDTSEVVGMYALFCSCGADTLDLSSFNTSKVTDVYNMFYDARFTNVNLSNFNTSKITNMNSLFGNCTNLVELDLTSFDTSNVTNTTSMFAHCYALKTIYVSENFNLDKTAEYNSNYMFNRCESIVGGAGTTYNSSKLNKEYARFDNPPDAPGYFTKKTDKRTVLYNDNTLIINELTKDSAENERIHGAVVKEYEPFGPSNPYDFNGPEDQPWSGEFDLITSLKFGSEVKPTKTARWFEDLVGLDNIDWTNFDTSEVVDMSKMFYNCTTLPNVDLSSFDTSKVENMESMFAQCHSFTDMDLSGFDTSSVENMNAMFRNCAGLLSLDLSGWDNSSVTDMGDMFLGCRWLENINLSNFNTSNVKIMSGMFSDCDVLENIDLSSFDTTNVEEMNSMFNKCGSLITLDLSNFNTSKVTTSIQIFKDCSLLKTIYASENLTFEQTYYDQNMFSNCTSLVGGAGTAYYSGYVDKRYARIDIPPAEPGYFTEKNPAPTGYPYTFGTVDGGSYELLPGAYSLITDKVSITGTPINEREVGKLTLKNVYANGTSYGDLETDLVINMTTTPYGQVNAIFESLEFGFHFQIIIMLNPDMSIVHALAMNTHAVDSLEISWSEGVFEVTGKSN